MAKPPAEKTDAATAHNTERPICGVIRPIAELGDYPATHWLDVHAIIADAAEAAGHRARLVSESDAAGVILSEIVGNLYNNPIVICDVSGRNPNVMFELGMRLAFEKPAIIIKDDTTPFSFDISPVKHLEYPRSLRFQKIIDFKSDLTKAINATIEAAVKPDHRGYLQQFGPIAVTQLGEQKLSLDAFAEELRDTQRMLRSMQAGTIASTRRGRPYNQPMLVRHYVLTSDNEDSADRYKSEIEKAVRSIPGTALLLTSLGDNDRWLVDVEYTGQNMREFNENFMRKMFAIPGVRGLTDAEVLN